MAEQARTIARGLDDHRVLVDVANTVQYPLDVPETLPERRQEMEQAFTLGEQGGDVGRLFWTAWLRSIVTMQAASPGELAHCMTTMQRLKDLRGYPVDQEMTFIRQSAVAMLEGNPSLAERCAADALTIGLERGLRDAWSTYGAQLIVVRWQQGRLGELVELAEQAAAENPGVPAFRAALVLTYWESGREKAAGELLGEAATDRFAEVTHDTGWLIAMHAYAEVAAQLHREDHAAVLFELLEPWHEQFGANPLVVSGPDARYLGSLATVLGRFEEAENYFVEAATLNERMGARFSMAQTELERAKLYLARRRLGDDARAAGHLRAARDLSEERGYALVGKRANDALADLS